MDRYDDGKYFVIDPDTRKIAVPFKYSSVIGDANSQILTFSIKRFIDGYDILNCNDVAIHYDILSEDDNSILYSDVYQCDDLRVSEDDENITLVSWVISKNATKFNGVLSFTVRYSTTYVDEDERVRESYSLQSRICERLKIFTRVNNSQQIVDEYGDLLQQWKEDLERSKPTASVEKVGNETTITITDKNGTTTANVIDGVNGESAYEIAVKNGFEGTEEEWLESLKYSSSEEFKQLAKQVKQDAKTATEKAQEATTAASNANAYANDAQTAKNDAIKAANSASTSANGAEESATNAANSASIAQNNAEKTQQDKETVTNLISGFDERVSEKITEFNQNASDKSDEFDSKVEQANTTIDEKVSEATKQAEKATEEANRATIATDEKLDKNLGAESANKLLGTDEAGNIVVKKEIEQTAENVKYGEDSNVDMALDDIYAKLGDLMYSPISITSFTNNKNTREMGSIVTDVVLNWNYNKTPKTLMLDSETLDVSLKTKTLSGQSIKTNKTFTLKATDERNAVATKTTAITFLNGVYYGVGDNLEIGSVTNEFILGLTKTLQANKSKTFTVNAGAGKHIYYIIPTRYGTPVFKVGGFEGGFEKLGTVNFTNASSYAENYDVYKSSNAGLGNTTVVAS